MKNLSKIISENPDLPNFQDQDNNSCMICMTNIPNCIFVPCGHGGFCFQCAELLIENAENCHYCRQVFLFVCNYFQPVSKVIQYNEKKEFKDFYKIIGVYAIEMVDDSQTGIIEQSEIENQSQSNIDYNPQMDNNNNNTQVRDSGIISSEIMEESNDDLAEFDEDIFQNLVN